MKPQCIVTSYQRPKYLKPCVESMRQDDIELYIVDGGSDEETKRYIREVSDGCIFLEDNPGADVLKNVGIQQFVTQPTFIMSSDDLEYPKGWAREIARHYAAVNNTQLRYTMLACATDGIAQSHGTKFSRIGDGCHVMEVGYSMVSGAMMDRAVVERVGYFPVYGKTGQGDFAISMRMRTLGYKVGYALNPTVRHIGATKFSDYPVYSAEFAADDEVWRPRALADKWRA